MDSLEKIIISNIQRLLIKHDLTQKQLAFKLKEPVSSINDILNPNSRMKIKPGHLDKIARLFNVEPSALLVRNFSKKKDLIETCTEMYLLMYHSDEVKNHMTDQIKHCKKSFKKELASIKDKKIKAILI